MSESCEEIHLSDAADSQLYRCSNCNFVSFNLEGLPPIKDLLQRVAPGEPMPAGECPTCGALVHIDEDSGPENVDPVPGLVRGQACHFGV